MKKKQIVYATASISVADDRDIIDQIVSVSTTASGSHLLNVAPEPDQARTLITIAGTPDDVADSLFGVAGKAIELLKLKKKSPYIGVIDSISFVPVRGCTLDDCKLLTKRFAKRVYQAHKVPFFYHNYKNYLLYREYAKLLNERGITGLTDRSARAP